MKLNVTLLVTLTGFLIGCSQDKETSHKDTTDSTNSGTVFLETQTSKLSASDGFNSNGFGYSIAVSGNTVLIGADQDDDNGKFSGSAYIFIRSGDGWAQQAKLTPDDGKVSDNFGTSVSLYEDYAMIGTRDGSAAYIFVRSGESWMRQTKLTSDIPEDDFFGETVSISGEYAITSGQNDKENGLAIHVFKRSGERWDLQTKLVPDDTERVGSAFAINGNDIIVGGFEIGSVYIFTRSGESWTQQAKLVPGDNEEGFGSAVAISGDDAMITARESAVYFFSRSGTTWTEQAQFYDGHYWGYGKSCAIYGNYALAGANLDGIAVVYSRANGEWKKHAVLNPDKSLDSFGYSVALGEDYAVIGDIYSEGTGVGAVYIYE